MEDNFILSQEDSYLMGLKMFLVKNKGKTEYDFLKENIELLKPKPISLEKREQLEKQYIEDLIKERPHYVKDKDIEAYVEQKLYYMNLRSDSSEVRRKRTLFDFEIRLNRLPKEDLKLNNKIKQIGNDIFPFRNKETLISFTTYTQQFIIDNYIDYSYLFQRLKKDNLIEFITHNDFFNWLKKNDFITDNTLNEFISKESFRSLSKSFSVSRDNNFNNTF